MTTSEAQKPSPEQIADVRAKTKEVGEKLKSDPAFKSEYRRDPAAALKAQGLPADAVRELLGKVAQAKGEGDVSGYELYTDTYYNDGWHVWTDRIHTDDSGSYLWEEWF